jgi:hypothetical protein
MRRPLAAGVAAGVAGLLGLVLVPLAPSADATSAAPSAAKACRRPAHGFVPRQARIPAVGRTVPVVVVPRTKDGAVGAVPTTESGKWVLSMDPQTKPGSRRGSVLLAGHTWPDGSALGNAMLQHLDKGARVFLLGKSGRRACYRVTERESYPADHVPARKAFRSSGPERIVIVACSGRRLGPGNWTRRTIWYASPAYPHPAKPAPAPAPPPSSGSDGGLLGGVLGGLLGGG